MNTVFAKASVYLSVAAGLLLVPLTTLAQAGPTIYKGLGGSGTGLEDVGGELPNQPLPELIGNIINVLLGVLGIIFVVLMVYAGYLYLTSAGEPEKVKKAKNMIGQAIIGLVIIVAAYAISAFVIDALLTVSGGGGNTPTSAACVPTPGNPCPGF